MIDDYFKIANYISLLLMYFTNSEHNEMKKYASGHFGNMANINYIYACLNKFYRDNNLSHQEIIGTGHSGLSLITNLYLSGKLYEYYGKYKLNRDGLNELINDFGSKIRSEINPTYPTTIYDGGELGYSLANAYGFAINSNKDYTTCIIGDGESETGTLSSSLFLNNIIKTKSKVLPIINLNGFKMSSESILNKMGKDNLINYYKSLGYDVIYVDYLKYSLLDALNKTLHLNHPLIIFSSPKGWTGIENEIIKIEGEIISHKDPLAGNPNKEKILNEWIKLYETRLFDDKFYNIIMSIKTKEKRDIFETKILDTREYYSSFSDMDALNDYIKNNQITIFSPDEIRSNKLSQGENVIEMLSETVLNGMYQGFSNNGRGLYIGYESFMPIIQSMVSQYLKYIKQNNIYKFRDLNGLTYILTSTCWENTYSHQNPEFCDNLLNKEYDFINVYYPKDGHDLVELTKKTINSNNCVNVIVSSKGSIKQYNTSYAEIEVLEEGTDMTLVATGDYMLYCAYKVKEKFKKRNLNARIVYVASPKHLCSLTREEINDFFKGKVFYFFHGYSKTIKALLYDIGIDAKVFGYRDESYDVGYFDEHIEKNIDSDTILKMIKEKI